MAFSRDPQQKYTFAVNGRNEAVHNLSTGQFIASFGRPGHQLGNFIHGHTMALDSQGNIYAGLTQNRGVDKFVRVG